MLPSIGGTNKWIIGGIVLALVVAGALLSYGRSVPVPFQTIRVGFDSSHVKDELVINNAQTWTDEWSRAFPGETVPQINFSSTTVLAEFDKLEPSAGYSIRVTQVSETMGSVHVEVILTIPGPTCAEIQVQSAPYHLVSIQKEELPTDFTTKINTKVC